MSFRDPPPMPEQFNHCKYGNAAYVRVVGAVAVRQDGSRILHGIDAVDHSGTVALAPGTTTSRARAGTVCRRRADWPMLRRRYHHRLQSRRSILQQRLVFSTALVDKLLTHSQQRYDTR